MAELELRDVSKTFGGKNRVVENVSMHVPDGSFAVLVGPSGCGKSTTLRMVAGLEATDSGEILIAGRKVNSLSPQRRNVAFVFQNYALYPHMTVADNMGFGLRMRGVPTKQLRERVNATSKILGIELLP